MTKNKPRLQNVENLKIKNELVFYFLSKKKAKSRLKPW